MQRRGFLAGILAAGVAPAFVGAKVLMPVQPLVVVPPQPLWLFPTIGDMTATEALRLVPGTCVVIGVRDAGGKVKPIGDTQ